MKFLTGQRPSKDSYSISVHFRNTNIALFRLINEIEARSAALTRAYEKTRDQHQIILTSINYASRIQRNLLPSENEFKKAFSDYSIIWNPRNMVGGDIYWIKTLRQGRCFAYATAPGAMILNL